MKRKDFEVLATTASTQREYAPQRWPSVASDVTVPFLQALITGLFIAVLITGIFWGFIGLDFTKTFALSVAVSVITAWFWRMDVVTQTLWNIEDIIGKDITGDKIVGKPPAVHLEITRGNKTEFAEIDGIGDHQRLRKFAILALTNRLNERMTHTEFGWTRDHWQGVRDDMISRQWATWKGGTDSIRLTEQGKENMREILKEVA